MAELRRVWEELMLPESRERDLEAKKGAKKFGITFFHLEHAKAGAMRAAEHEASDDGDREGEVEMMKGAKKFDLTFFHLEHEAAGESMFAAGAEDSEEPEAIDWTKIVFSNLNPGERAETLAKLATGFAEKREREDKDLEMVEVLRRALPNARETELQRWVNAHKAKRTLDAAAKEDLEEMLPATYPDHQRMKLHSDLNQLLTK